MIMTSTAKPKSTGSTPPGTTTMPKLEIQSALRKRDFTVPDYLTDWYFYGRIDPGCSCIITSALPSIVTSSTTTSTSYHVTLASIHIPYPWMVTDNFAEYNDYRDLYHLSVRKMHPHVAESYSSPFNCKCEDGSRDEAFN